jgi:hypothetical protein
LYCLSTEGFAFVRKGSGMGMKVYWDGAEDLDVLLTRFKAAILTWKESHPVKALKKSAADAAQVPQ